MASIRKKIQWFFRYIPQCFKKSRFNCPNCGSVASKLLDVKYFVFSLRKCSECGLNFRCPTDNNKYFEDYYNCDYQQGITTQMPSQVEIAYFRDMHFKGMGVSYAEALKLIKNFYDPGAVVFEFGCSWGYGLQQLKNEGYDAVGYDVARQRRLFATNQLKIKTVEKIGDAPVADVFLSHNVMEHMVSPVEMISDAKKVLNKDGLFIAITSNGSIDYRAQHLSSWHKLWGHDHPSHIDEAFLKNAFKKAPFFITALPWNQDMLNEWKKTRSQIVANLSSGSELLVCAYPHGSL